MADDDAALWSRAAVQPHEVAQNSMPPRGNSSANANSKTASTRSHGDSKGKSDQRRNSSSQVIEHKNALLRWRVYTIEEYSEEFYSRPTGQKVVPPGTLPTPIPVPLYPGETVAEYEQKFLVYLTARGRTPAEFVGKPNHERSLRIEFGNKRLLPKGTIRNGAHAARRAAAPNANSTKSSNSSNSNSNSNSAKREQSESPHRYSKSTSSTKRGRSESPPAHRKRPTSAASAGGDTKDYTFPATTAAAGALSRSSSSSSSSTTAASSARSAPPDMHMHAPPRPLVVTKSGGALAAMPVPAAAPPVQHCIAQLPASHASRTAFVAAYVACGCRQCMCDWNLMLTEQLEVLENEMHSLRAQRSVDAAAKPVSAATAAPAPLKTASADVPVAPKVGSAVAGPVDASHRHKSEHKQLEQGVSATEAPRGSATSGASTSDSNRAASHAAEMTNGSDPAPVHTVSLLTTTSSTTAAAAAVAAADDPIRTRLLDEYNALNSQILLNEQVVEDSIQRVRANMAHDMAGAMHEHEQIQQLQDAIECEVERRDEALAVLIVHCHEHACDQLLAQVDALGSLNIAHAQRASHTKCATFAAQISAKRSSLARLRSVLAHMAADTSSAAVGHELQALEMQITAEQHALAALEQRRMEEIMELFRFSHQVRADCRALLVPNTTSNSSSSNQ